ncbi:MAG: autotransporter-associated beta strand repeat-containing protein, partial [Verrucomicrobiota bacterium]
MNAFRQRCSERRVAIACWAGLVASGLLLCASLAPAQYATQTFLYSNTSTNVGWSVSSNAWTGGVPWTNGNLAVFSNGVGGGIPTATVYAVSTYGVSFQRYNGVYFFQTGTGALTNGAGGIYSANGNSMTFRSDFVMSANQSWMINNGATLTVTGLISGAGIQLTISGAGDVKLNSPANSFSGGLVINNGTLTGTGGGTVLGTGPITLGTVVPTNVQDGMQAIQTVVIATLNVNAGAANTTTTAGNLTINGGAVLQLNDTANITNTLNAGTLARQGTGTLVVIAANLGTREQVYFSGGTTLNNGILAPWLVTSGNNGDFLTYGAKGLTNATYTSVFGANNVVSTNVLTTLATPQSAYALKLNGVNLNLNGNALTIGDGTTAGLILNSASITNGGAAASLTFGTAEALVYSANTGTIGVEISGSSGLTFFGAGTLVISNQNLWSGPITINGGTVVLSPTADLTYTNNITGPGSLTKAGSRTLILTNGLIVGNNININGGTLNLGGGTTVVNTLSFNGGNNTLVISNGADVYPLNTWTIGGTGTNTLIVTGAGSMLTNGNNATINLNGTGNGLIISSGAVVTATGAYIGTGATASNFVLVTGPGSILSNYNFFSGYSPLIIGNGTGNGNSVIVSNGGAVWTVDPRNNNGMMMGFSTGNSNSLLVTGSGSVDTNAGTVYIGYGANSAYNFVSVVNSGKFAMQGGLSIGTQSGSSSNSVTVSGTNSSLWASGALLIGGNAAYTGNFGNQLIVSNGGQAVTLGAASIGTSPNSGYNAVTVTGGGSVWSNTGVVIIGSTNSIGNALVVSNGGAFYGGGAITVGWGGGSSNNTYAIADSTVSNNGLITIGYIGGGNNTLTTTNATMSSKGLTIGNGSSNNTVTVSNNVTWNFMGSALTFGNGTGNVLNVAADGTTVLTNIGGITMNDTGR